MGDAHKSEELIEQARSLYASGLSNEEIADLLGARPRTVRDWKLRDQKRGVSWDRERELERQLNPERILKSLQRRLSRMALELGQDESADDADSRDGRDASLLKMLQIINGFRQSCGELTQLLCAMDRFAGFCSENLPGDELAAVRRAVAKFMNRLKRENQ